MGPYTQAGKLEEVHCLRVLQHVEPDLFLGRMSPPHHSDWIGDEGNSLAEKKLRAGTHFRREGNECLPSSGEGRLMQQLVAQYF